MKRNFFGTDGIRGIPNKEPLTLENMIELGRAIAYIFKNEKDKKIKRKGTILIGRDTRSSGYMLELALASGITSMGMDVFFVGALPTPAIAFLAKDMRADSGIIISASHNPYTDNGIKIFDSQGYKLSDELEYKIESLMFSEELKNNVAEPNNMGKVEDLVDAKSRYIVFAKKTFPQELNLRGMKIVVDCSNGATYEVAPSILRELGAEVIAVADKPDGININDNCGALHPENIIDLVKKNNANIGISLDGDGDRVVLIDEKGNIVDGDYIMAMIAMHLKESNQLRKNTIVTTPMVNVGFSVAMKKNDINVVTTDVGDRYVVQKMKESNYNFGGEQSGHIVFLDYTTTGDGIIAALQVLSYMIRSNNKLSLLTNVMEKYPQVLLNIKIKEKIPFDKIPNFLSTINKIENELKNEGRVFVRYSGTEPIARIMIEGKDEKQINTYAKTLSQLIKN